MIDLSPEELRVAAEFGAPRIQNIAVNPRKFWSSTTQNRNAEVCMVVRRPSGRILVFRKTFYPSGVLRLLTGGIEPGESIVDALRREVTEETGLDVRVERYLALVRFPSGDLLWCRQACTAHRYDWGVRGGRWPAITPHVRSFGRFFHNEGHWSGTEGIHSW
jgi:8-oxo-dGTP pyrophosphatase MutT (NUDIX family)